MSMEKCLDRMAHTFWDDVDMPARYQYSSLNQPGQTETNQNIEYIGANRIGNRHIAVAFLDNSYGT